MEMEGYSMRPIEEKDLRLILNWRNSPRVHDRMLTDHEITLEEHMAWFERYKSNSCPMSFLFLYEDEPLGYISYINPKTNPTEYSIGVYLGELRDNPMDGLFLYLLATKYGFEKLNAEYLNEEIFTDNTEALTISRYIGYKDVRIEREACQKNGKSKDIQILTFNKNGWEVFVKGRL